MVGKMNNCKKPKWLKNGKTGRINDSRKKRCKYLKKTIQEMTQDTRI